MMVRSGAVIILWRRFLSLLLCLSFLFMNVVAGQQVPAKVKPQSSEVRMNRTTVRKTAKAAGSNQKAAITGAKTTNPGKPTFASVKPLLVKNTCAACHNETKRQVGPAFADVAKRKYTVAEIIGLVRNPRRENWPDFETPMPPLPQVPKADLQKIALWINSLEK